MNTSTHAVLTQDDAAAEIKPTVPVAHKGEEGEEEGDYSSDDVVVPWKSPICQPMTMKYEHMDPTMRSSSDHEEVEDGYYSEDAIFDNGTPYLYRKTLVSFPAVVTSQLSQVHDSAGSFSYGPDDILAKQKPAFAPTCSTDADVPLILDPLDLDIKVPGPINRYLKEYQRDGVKFLYNKYVQGTGGVLGDDMGYVSVMKANGFRPR